MKKSIKFNVKPEWDEIEKIRNESAEFLQSHQLTDDTIHSLSMIISELIENGIKYGVRKVNIDTDLRMASTGAIRRHLHDNPSNFDPRKFLKESTVAMKEICKARYEAFGCAGNASKIKLISLEKMVDIYKSSRINLSLKKRGLSPLFCA